MNVIAYKFNLDYELGIEQWISEYNCVFRFGFNRLKEGMNRTEAVRTVKATMKNINLMDASLISMAVGKALQVKDVNPVFGGKKNFVKRIQHKITKEEYKKSKLIPMQLVGSNGDNNGNRKAELDIIDNGSVILKLNKATHISIKLPYLDNGRRHDLELLQELSEANQCHFTLDVTNTSVTIIFDECILAKPRNHIVSNRILSFDMNPNYVGISIIDWTSPTEKTIVHKEIISLKAINGLPHNGYQTDKRQYETYEVCKHIISLALHYEVETVSFEKLSMPSKDNKLGKWFNKLVNNYWIRSAFVNNIRKRCNIASIKYLEVVPQYSSFIGQLLNPNDYDSVAASIELSRRTYLYKAIYIDKTLEPQNVVFPEFDIGYLNLQWKDRLGDIPNNIMNWKDLFKWVKKSKYSYRFLFSENEKFFKLKSHKSLVKVYICA